jgi:hypothetical protein
MRTKIDTARVIPSHVQKAVKIVCKPPTGHDMHSPVSEVSYHTNRLNDVVNKCRLDVLLEIKIAE